MIIEESKELINEQANQLMERVNNLNVELSDWAIADILTYVQNEMTIVCNGSNRYKFLISYSTENKFTINIKIADVLRQKMLVHKKETTIPSYPPAEPIFLKTSEGVVFRECIARKQIKIENQKRSCWSIAPSRPRKYWSEDILDLIFKRYLKCLELKKYQRI